MKTAAFQVQDLTVARYFAAFLVDYMHFHISDSDNLSDQLTHYKEIINWIDGPEIMISTDLTDLDHIFQINESLNPQYFLCSNDLRERLAHSFSDLKFISDDPIFIDEDDDFFIANDPESLNSSISIPILQKISQLSELKRLNVENLHGIGLEAGVEEATGIKDFTEVDEIMDYLETLR